MPTLIAPRDAVPFEKISRVLVVKLLNHGDVLLTSPIYSVLKAHHPHLEIDALIYADSEAMLSQLPAISQLHLVTRRQHCPDVKTYLRAEHRLFSTLRSRRYDLLIHLTENRRGLVLTHLLRPRYRVAYRYANRSILWQHSFTHFVPNAGPRRHTVEKHLDTLRRIGLQPTPQERRLVLSIPNDVQERVAVILANQGIAAKTFIHVHPTSRWLFKCWEPAKFAQTINLLRERGLPVVLTAAPNAMENEFIQQILTRVEYPVVNLAGQLGLKELAAVTQNAKCFVGVDSVPMHIAAAVQTPVVVLFGPSGDVEWGPWQVPHRIITTQPPCRPCGFDGCGGGKVSECLTDISVTQVFNAILDLVGN